MITVYCENTQKASAISWAVILISVVNIVSGQASYNDLNHWIWKFTALNPKTNLHSCGSGHVNCEARELITF